VCAVDIGAANNIVSLFINDIVSVPRQRAIVFLNFEISKGTLERPMGMLRFLENPLAEDLQIQ